ncbi:MAG: hypothetical protein H0V44_17490 [Planctomycetes bacterium]|nr:hypothetical protein [Planctomycetota bacterium]
MPVIAMRFLSTICLLLAIAAAPAMEREMDGPHHHLWTLGSAADLDPSAPSHFETIDRVGAVGEADGSVYRALKPDQFQVLWSMPAFALGPEHGAISQVFYLSVRFKDIAQKPMHFWSWRGGEGFYGKSILGEVGGAGDGAWKEETLVIPRSMLRSGDGRSLRFGVNNITAAIPVASMLLFSTDADLADRDLRITRAHALLRERRAAAVARAKDGMNDLGLPDPGAPGAPTSEDTKRGFSVFFPPVSRQLFANSLPSGSDARCQIRICPGESRSVLVAIRAIADLGRVGVAFSDPTSASGRIALSGAPVRWARYSIQKVGSSWSKDYRESPEHLSRGDPVIAPDRLGIACVTVRVPDGAGPGTYLGTLSITSERGGAAALPVSVEVLPFTLEHPAHATHGLFYYADYAEMSPFDLRDMRDHGIDMLVTGLLPKLSPGPQQTVAMDMTAVRATFAELKQLGFRSPMISSTGSLIDLVRSNARTADGSPEHHRAFSSVLTAIMDAAKAEGFTDTGFFPVDEPHTDPLIASALKACSWIRETPGARSYITANPKAVGVLQPVLDYDAYNLVYLTPEVGAEVKAAGATLMFYTSSVDVNPESNRYRAGFYFAKTGARSMQFFAYSLFEHDHHADFDGEHRDWNIVFPSMDEPTHDPTLEWEAVREGVYDYRYAYTLRAAAERARAEGRGGAADQALQTLESVLAPIDPIGKNAATPEQAIEADVRLKEERPDAAQDDGRRMAADWYESSRQRIADAIVRVQRTAP